jgi:hypothetical protein
MKDVMRSCFVSTLLLASALTFPCRVEGSETTPAQKVARLRSKLARHPESGLLLWLLAVAELQAGNPSGAAQELRRAHEAGLELNLEDPRLAPLRGDPAFQGLAKEVRQTRPPIPAGPTAFRIPEKDLIPEGIAFDPGDESFYVGSILKRKIVRVRRDGSVADLIGPKEGVPGDVLGLRVDAAPRRLWAAVAVRDGRPKDRPSTALLLVELPSGRIRASYEPADDGKHLFNDIALLPDGTVFVTDSEAGTVYSLRPGDTRLSRLLPPGSFDYPNGIAPSEDGRAVYVADGLDGVTRLDLSTGKRTVLRRPKGVSIDGIDGLYLVSGGLVAVQNITGVDRVAWFGLDPTGTRVVSARVLARADPRFHIPTTAAVAPDGIYLLANSLIDALGDDGALRPGRELSEPLVVKVPLPATR